MARVATPSTIDAPITISPVVTSAPKILGWA